MTLAVRLVLAVVLTAVFSVTVTGYLSMQAASEPVARAFGMPDARGQRPGATARPMAGAAAASRQLLSELRTATWRAAAIALAAAAVAGGWIASRASRPLERLADVTRRYGAGARDARAAPSGPSEVVALARAFNDLADRLQEEEGQRRRFTSDVAHELRTPLTVLKSELEAIEDGLMEADPATVAQLLQQVDLLARLVQDLRTLASAESGEMELERASFDLGGLVASA
ncbi:MAG: histidine kinase dimerization/phospho-acceptor domain-containing protein, partial [Trueperaceae bacterium]|nr:histidine kinase dimerization/phospho-acceptor domain-containing protein [Trueperaceae bacterium]